MSTAPSRQRRSPASSKVYVLAALTLLTGCRRNFFTAHGQVGTDGAAFGQWAATPMGCSRDPTDALSDSQTRTVATFVWESPADHDSRYNGNNDPPAPDAPMQLNVLRTDGGGYNVRLKTLFTDGQLITPEDCSTLKIETREQGPGFPGGRSSLAGSVSLECRVKKSRVWADFTFERCEY